MDPLTNKSTPICDIGVYITAVIEEAEKYSHGGIYFGVILIL